MERVDVNSATDEELQRLQGIGPALARRIVERRQEEGPFSSVDELLALKGMRPSTLAGIRDQIVAGPAKRARAKPSPEPEESREAGEATAAEASSFAQEEAREAIEEPSRPVLPSGPEQAPAIPDRGEGVVPWYSPVLTVAGERARLLISLALTVATVTVAVLVLRRFFDQGR